jgi:hypothetical protein
VRRQIAWIGLALVLLVGLGAASVLAQQAGETVTLGDYQARLDRAIGALEGERGAASVQAAREVLAPVAAVRLASGESVAVAPLLPEGISHEVTLDRLRLLREQVAASSGDDTANRLALLRGVLARREFSVLARGPNLWERFLEWLRWIMPRSAPGEVTPVVDALAGGTGWLLAVGGGLAIALLLSYWLAGLIGGMVADAEARRRRAAGELEPVTAAAARQQARALAQVGNYRQAVRHLYLSALLHLEEHALLRRDRSLTNHEYLNQAATNPELHRHLKPVVETFDAVWYGVHEPDQATFVRYQGEIDRLAEKVS